jgi:hypothetical protein
LGARSEKERETKERRKPTTGVARAHGPVRRAARVAANVADARVVQALVAKVLAVQVLDAPEAAGGDRGRLGALGYRGGGGPAGRVARDAEAGRRGEGPGQAGHKVGQLEGHEGGGDRDGEERDYDGLQLLLDGGQDCRRGRERWAS